MRIAIDAAACTGHGRCYSLAPELFDCDDEGHGVALVGEHAPDQEEAARTAAVSCPERAVMLSD